MRRKLKMIAGLCICMLFCMLCCASCQKEEGQLLAVEAEHWESIEQETVSQADVVYVDVCGAVKKEGVYELPAGSRVYEAIEAAGGFRKDAAVTAINQAEVLKDEQQLYVPTTKEWMVTETAEDGKINLNTATKEELMTLSGVGEAKAESIIAYRQEHGSFQSIEEIMNISGIKDGLFEKIKDAITV